MADDKINISDPAAAPMSTDAEVAGTPTPKAAEKADAKMRAGISASHPHPKTFGANRQRRGTDPLGLILIGGAVALAAAGVVTAWWGLP